MVPTASPTLFAWLFFPVRRPLVFPAFVCFSEGAAAARCLRLMTWTVEPTLAPLLEGLRAGLPVEAVARGVFFMGSPFMRQVNLRMG